jgi:hypothetical protein
LLFLGTNFHIVVHPDTSISSTGINAIKHWPSILIYAIFILFSLPVPNLQLLQGQVIHATRSDGTDHRGTSDLVGIFLSACNENQNYAPWELFATQDCIYLKSNILSFFYIEGLHISASNLSEFCRSTRAVSRADFSFP